ncbi:hypothetical protein TorRG33x02_277930 [Trema orientale]|uniref:Uncharacterized protein n=1 Tax=Trema orientale TaxID=63057 RepID=A0A2P5CP10_TREOI|nr:hypothetical protein TorRG33x02_277930 [Trema orientale]
MVRIGACPTCARGVTRTVGTGDMWAPRANGWRRNVQACPIRCISSLVHSVWPPISQRHVIWSKSGLVSANEM